MIQLSPKGAQRFYASCCNTPVANAVGPKTSFTGVLTDFIDIAPEERDNTLGPVISYCMAKYAIGTPPANADPKFPFLLLVKVMKKMLIGKVLGQHKPNSLYNLELGKPICEQQLMDKATREQIRNKINRAMNAQ